MKSTFQARTLLLTLAAALLAACASTNPGPGAEVRQALAPTGKLRAALYPGTPTSILRDAKGGEPRGVGYELGKEMAKRLGVPYEPVVYPKNDDVLKAVTNGEADVAFTNASPARQKVMNFTPPFMFVELGYLVGPDSKLTSVADVDRPGLRVGVTERSSSDATLSRDLKNATVVRSTTLKQGIDMLAAHQIDAYATNKATLSEMSDTIPGSRVIAGRWGVEHFAIAMPKGREAGMAFASKFAADVKAEGLVKAAADRAGLRGTTDAP
jgi:polar amino acid transport system substrate-binding protein